jgi:hypothetical protein
LYACAAISGLTALALALLALANPRRSAGSAAFPPD